MCEISVIVPVYNVEKYIRKCIIGIMEQTFRDFEVIIVDDGSKDDSIAAIKDLLYDTRIKVIHKKNEGLPQARKTGFLHAKGNFVMFIDSDDWIEPDMLEKMHAAIIREKADIVSCGLFFENANGEILKTATISHTIHLTSEQAVKYIHQTKAVYTYMWNKIFRKNVITESCFPFGHFIGEDYCTMMNILKKERLVVHIEDVLYHYVQHDSNMLKAGFGDSQRLAYERYRELRPQLMESYPDLNNIILHYHLLEEMAIINSMIRNGIYDRNLKRDIIKDLRKNVLSYVVSKDNYWLYKFSMIMMLICFPLYKRIYKKWGVGRI